MAWIVGLPLAAVTSVLVLSIASPPGPVVAGLLLLVATVAGATMRPLSARAGWDAVGLGGVAGLLLPAAVAARATARLLGAPPAARLAWMLGEEDNAHVVGVARELLEGGPLGAELAMQYGTSFAVPGVGLVRTGVAGTLSGDPRLDAITATTASAAALPVVVGLALVLAAVAVRAAGRPVDPAAAADTAEQRRPGATASGATATLLASLVIGATVQLLVVALPLQLGFATLSWAIAWVLVGWAAALGLRVPGLPLVTRAALAGQLAAAAILLEGAWPFLAGALLLPIGLVVAAATLRRSGTGTLRPPSGRTVAIAVVAVGASAALLARSGAVRTVLGLGREALTAGVEVGSSIVSVGWGLRAGALVAVLVAAAALRGRWVDSAVVVGAAGGALATLGAVAVVASVVADGIVGYGGSKLLLATVLLAVAAGAVVVASGRGGWAGVVAAAAVAVVAVGDPLGRTSLGWWDRTAPSSPPHAVATVTALESSSPGLPIRCRPAPGTPATAAAKLAAYFCIVWMEDAFNAGPDSGNRFEFFQTEDPTFDGVLARAEAEGLYGFAFPLRLGPGWFGWDGAS